VSRKVGKPPKSLEESLTELKQSLDETRKGARSILEAFPKPIRERGQLSDILPRPIINLIETRKTLFLREPILKRLRKRLE